MAVDTVDYAPLLEVCPSAPNPSWPRPYTPSPPRTLRMSVASAFTWASDKYSPRWASCNRHHTVTHYSYALSPQALRSISLWRPHRTRTAHSASVSAGSNALCWAYTRRLRVISLGA